jgi:hypothetical protein
MPHMKPFRVSIFLVACLLSACSKNDSAPHATAPATWQSQFHPLKLTYKDPFARIDPSEDSNEKALIGLIDKSDGASYVVRIGRDLPLDDVSDDNLYLAMKKQMIQAHKGNKLISESDVKLHGSTFHHLRFEMFNAKFNKPMCIDAYSRRTGKWSISVQWSFPYVGQLTEKLKSCQTTGMNKKRETTRRLP